MSWKTHWAHFIIPNHISSALPKTSQRRGGRKKHQSCLLVFYWVKLFAQATAKCFLCFWTPTLGEKKKRKKNGTDVIAVRTSSLKSHWLHMEALLPPLAKHGKGNTNTAPIRAWSHPDCWQAGKYAPSTCNVIFTRNCLSLIFSVIISEPKPDCIFIITTAGSWYAWR